MGKERKPCPSIPDTIKALKLYLARRAPGTQKRYLSEWGFFVDWLTKKRIGLDKLSDMTGIAYIDFVSKRPGQNLKKRGLRKTTISKSTMRNKAVILHSMASYLMAHHYLDCDPFSLAMEQLEGVHAGDRRPTQMIPFESVKEILKLYPGSNAYQRVQSCLQALLFGLGLRAGECINIKLQDVKATAEGVLYVELPETKSGNCQHAACADWVAERITALVAIRKATGAKPNSSLLALYYRNGRLRIDHLSRCALTKSFRAWCRMVGLNDGLYSPHSARATAITKLLADGESYDAVKNFSRHSSVAMVEHYNKIRFTVESAPGRKIGY